MISKKNILYLCLFIVFTYAAIYQNNTIGEKTISDNKNKDYVPTNNTGTNNPSSTLPSNVSDLTDDEPLLPFGQVTRDDAIKHIEWAFRSGKPYDTFALNSAGGSDYAISYYQIRSIDQSSGEVIDDSKGLLIFKIIDSKPKIIWELQNIPSYIHQTATVQDVTGDNQNDIVSLWSNGKYDGLYIISYDNDKNDFRLISPMTKSGLLSQFTSNEGTIKLIDLDDDQIPEITFPTEKDIHISQTTGDSVSTKMFTAYKWNGTEYVLWKEQQEPFTVQPQ